MGLDALIERKKQDSTEKSLKMVATAIPAIRAIPATKIALVKPLTDHTAEPTRIEKMHELTLLVNFVGGNENWTEEEFFEAKYHAENDLENALPCFRELARAVRQVKVLNILKENPESQRAVYADTVSSQSDVIITVAILGYATCDFRVSKTKYDPFQLLDLIEKYGSETH